MNCLEVKYHYCSEYMAVISLIANSIATAVYLFYTSTILHYLASKS